MIIHTDTGKTRLHRRQARIDKIGRLDDEFNRLLDINAPQAEFVWLAEEYDDPNPALRLIYLPKPLLEQIGRTQPAEPAKKKQVTLAETHAKILATIEAHGSIFPDDLAAELDIPAATLKHHIRLLRHAGKIGWKTGRLVVKKVDENLVDTRKDAR